MATKFCSHCEGYGFLMEGCDRVCCPCCEGSREEPARPEEPAMTEAELELMFARYEAEGFYSVLKGGL